MIIVQNSETGAMHLFTTKIVLRNFMKINELQFFEGSKFTLAKDDYDIEVDDLEWSVLYNLPVYNGKTKFIREDRKDE